MNTARHMDPVEDAGRYADAQDASDASSVALYSQMKAAFLDAIRAGRDETMPSTSIARTPLPGQRVAEWLSSCDDKQEQLLFQLLHLCLNRDNLAAIHEAAEKFAASAAVDFADLYVESRL